MPNLNTEAFKNILNDKLKNIFFYQNFLFKEFDETWGPWLAFFKINK